MDMDFTPEQDLLRDSVRRTFERHGGLDVVRKLENDPIGYSPALWTQLGELGVLGVTIDEQYGGSGMTMVDAAVIYEEFGRALVPSPHLVSCVLAAGLIGRSPDEALKDRVLPAIASGESIADRRVASSPTRFGPAGVQLTATPRGHGWRLSGRRCTCRSPRPPSRSLSSPAPPPGATRPASSPPRPAPPPRASARTAADRRERRAVPGDVRRTCASSRPTWSTREATHGRAGTRRCSTASP